MVLMTLSTSFVFQTSFVIRLLKCFVRHTKFIVICIVCQKFIENNVPSLASSNLNKQQQQQKTFLLLLPLNKIFPEPQNKLDGWT